MANMDPLAQLKDIHLPDAVGLWPLAWGWWVLLILLVLIALTAFLMLRRHRQRNRYRAAALAELQQLVSLWLQKHRNQWQKTPVRKTAAKTLLPTRAQPEAPVDNQPADKHPVNNKETRNA